MQCPKCSDSDVFVRYMPDENLCDFNRKYRGPGHPHMPCRDIKGEHFEHNCRNCQYEWSIAFNDDRYYLDLKGAHERLCRLEITVDEKHKWLIGIALKVTGWLLDNTTDARNSYGPETFWAEDLLKGQKHD